MLKRAVAGVGAEDREEEQRGVTSDSVNNCKENENDTEASFVITDLNNPKSQGYVSSAELTSLEQGLRYRGRRAARWLLCSNLHTDPTTPCTPRDTKIQNCEQLATEDPLRNINTGITKV